MSGDSDKDKILSESESELRISQSPLNWFFGLATVPFIGTATQSFRKGISPRSGFFAVAPDILLHFGQT